MKTRIERPLAILSCASLASTILFASISHADRYGHPAYLAGILLAGTACGLNTWLRRTGSRGAVAAYVLFNLWAIVGLGLVNGLWNHLVKVSLFWLHGGILPPALAGMFSDPRLGGTIVEGAWVLTFAASLVSAYAGYRVLSGDLHRTPGTEHHEQ